MRVLIVRGHQVTTWGLRPWLDLPDRFEVSYLVTKKNLFPVEPIGLESVGAKALRNYLPPGRVGDLFAGLTGDRYLDAEEEFARADIVHTEELGFWHSGEAARLKPRHGYKLVSTVWETLPLLETFRNRYARVYRRRALEAVDLFLATTERARDSLVLEGVDPDRVEVSYPAVDVDRFAAAAQATERPGEHVVISPGRLVWEKGHHDVMRAVAALRHGHVPCPEDARPRLVVVGSGPEEGRLRAYARELGIADAVEFRSVPYYEMPSLYARASCMVLASLPSAGCSLYLGDLPRCFWEEQFGLVLVEAMAAGLAILASTCGAIPEVVGGAADLF
ncbi:MAG: glycosyltransferase family 4 protein, partial [Dehalococcoidia bacterium]